MRVKNKQEILERVNENKAKLQTLGVTKIGLFGSYVRDEQISSSDIDLLVNFAKGKKTYRNYYQLAEMVEEILEADVDLLTPQSISPYILPHIEKEVDYVQIAD